MISTLLALVAFSEATQEPIDFQLGWKKGDRLTYTVSMGDKTKPVIISGDIVLSVLSENEKGFKVSTTRIEYKGDVNYFPRTPVGTFTFTRKGRVTAISEGNERDFRADMYFVFAVLPSKPVSVGDKFSVKLNYRGTPSDLEGTFVSFDAKSNLAKFELIGTSAYEEGPNTPLKIKSTFDTKRKIFVSLSEDLNDGWMTKSFKLKERLK